MGNFVFYFFGLGCLLFYLAHQQYQKTVFLLEKGVRTTSVVTGLIPYSSDDGTTYAPVFEFKDRQRNTHTFESDIKSSPPAFKVGEKVKIIYDPKNAENVKVISFWGLYRWTIILSMVGSPLLILGGSYLWYIYF